MELVSLKECQVFRDRFLATHLILCPQLEPDKAPSLPQDGTNTCLSVKKKHKEMTVQEYGDIEWHCGGCLG